MTIVKIFITNNFFLFLLYSIAGDLSMGTRRKNVKSLRIFRLGGSAEKVCLVTRARHKEKAAYFPFPAEKVPGKNKNPGKTGVFEAAVFFTANHGANAGTRTQNVAVGGLCFIQLDYTRIAGKPVAGIPLCSVARKSATFLYSIANST